MSEAITDLLSSSDYDEKKIEEHYIWKKNSPHLYNILVTQLLEWPSYNIQFYPEKITTLTNKEEYFTYRLLLSTNASGSEKEYIIISELKLPGNIEIDAKKYTEKGEVGGFGIVDGGIDILSETNTKTSAIYINTEATVNRVRYMPQNPDLIACRTDFNDILLFDRTKHPSGKPKEPKCTPLARLKGHTRPGYALSWSGLKQGYLLTGGDDFIVNLYDVMSTPASTSEVIIDPLRSFTGHKNVVNDVQFCPFNENIFGSASDDYNINIWDIRSDICDGIKPLLQMTGKGEVQCLSFNPFSEHLIAAGYMNSEVVLWDKRKPEKPLHTLLGHEDQVLAINWSPFGEKILGTSSKDASVIIWDVSKIGADAEEKFEGEEDEDDIAPEVLFIHKGHLDEVSDFSWNAAEDWMIASVSADNVVQVWQVTEGIYEDSDEEEEVVDEASLE